MDGMRRIFRPMILKDICGRMTMGHSLPSLESQIVKAINKQSLVSAIK